MFRQSQILGCRPMNRMFLISWVRISFLSGSEDFARVLGNAVQDRIFRVLAIRTGNQILPESLHLG